MRWPRFRRGPSPIVPDIPNDPEALDHLLSRYIVEISDETVDEICRNLSALPSNRPALTTRAVVPGGRVAPLFWPGVGLAFGMLLLGIVIGTAGLPIPLTAVETQPEFSDLLMPQGT